MSKPSVAIVVHAEPASPRNALTEPKYSKLAARFVEHGFDIHSIGYHDSTTSQLEDELKQHDAVLVWVNPIEKGHDRKTLDELLSKISKQKVFVSCLPDVILKIGTKDILYQTRNEEFGTDVKRYSSFPDFKQRFLSGDPETRVLKQYRGNGGNGVYKVDKGVLRDNWVIVTHASEGDQTNSMTIDDFFDAFEGYFNDGGMLIDQPWNDGIVNGMVRCYLSGKTVVGFGYQETNALYPIVDGVFRKPSQRFYYTEQCGLFQDLRHKMEDDWVWRLLHVADLDESMLPVIWDADFFINNVNEEQVSKKYSLCEINVSSVSPFPESAIEYIIRAVGEKIKK